MAAIVHVYGLIRAAEAAVSRKSNEAFGTRLNVITEPEGDTLSAMVFSRTMPPYEAERLRGQDVHLIVAVEKRDGGTDFNVVRVEPWTNPNPIVQASPASPLSAVRSDDEAESA